MNSVRSAFAGHMVAQMNSKAGGVRSMPRCSRGCPGGKMACTGRWRITKPASSFEPLVADTHAQGVGRHLGTSTHPVYGYYFRILTLREKAMAHRLMKEARGQIIPLLIKFLN
jgi:hypothetical protein